MFELCEGKKRNANNGKNEMLVNLTPKHFTPPTKKQIADSRKVMRSYGVNSLLSIGTDPKTEKSNESGKGYFTAIQYLAPASVSGYNTCPASSAGCRAACLHTAGNPIYFKGKNKARIARTRFFFEQRAHYFNVLYAEITSFVGKCATYGLKPAVRLNGTSDIIWENVAPWIFELFPMVQFYDYTKFAKRVQVGWVLPVNYDLTFSRSEANGDVVLQVLRDNPKARVAVVFGITRTKPLPTEWEGFTVANADADDLRFLDTARIAGLHAKGDARSDDSGFTVRTACGV